MPPTSWPRIAGNSPSGSAPDSVKASVWHTPEATIRTSTSPVLGPPRSTVSIINGLPASQATAALVFTYVQLRACATPPPPRKPQQLTCQRGLRCNGAARSPIAGAQRPAGGSRGRRCRYVTKCAAQRGTPSVPIPTQSATYLALGRDTPAALGRVFAALRRLRQSHKFRRIPRRVPGRS